MTRCNAYRKLVAAAGALAAFACSSDAVSNRDASKGNAAGSGAGSAGTSAAGGEAGVFGNAPPAPIAGASGAGAAGAGVAPPVDAGTSDAALDENNACGMGSAKAELTPVNMLVMFDRSASMDDNDKWPNATAALIAFFEHPESAGLRVAFRFFPDREPGCNEDGCDAMVCSQVLVDLDELTAEPAPTDAHEGLLVGAIVNAGERGGGGTPIHAALDGALRWGTAQQMASPTERTVVIFVTDGEPNGCDQDFDNIAALAADALATAGVSTYAIGLEGSSEAQMDQLAMAGGTNAGIFIGNSANAEAELLAALNAIRGETLSCDFPMPEPADPSMTFDPARINVTFTPGMGSAATFPQVADASACADSNAWHYDDPGDPTRIVLCPAACETVRSDPNAELAILIGCATCGGLDTDCGGDPPPGVPPVFVE